MVNAGFSNIRGDNSPPRNEDEAEIVKETQGQGGIKGSNILQNELKDRLGMAAVTDKKNSNNSHRNSD